jgi:diguanylate cyclase (GGDEF)-like protein
MERTPLTELGALPLSRIVAEAPPLIGTILGALDDPARGPAELARAARDLEGLFGEDPQPKAEPPPSERPAAVPPDRLTGLPGSGDLDRCMKDLLAEQRRYGHPFSLALIDVDGLARINEAYGREAGDRMLAAIASILRRELRDADFAFRVEDDEFAVIAPHTEPERLVPVARRIANLIASSQVPSGPRIAIAAGVVGCPADGLGVERLLESATEAIYAAKASGAAVARSANGSGTVLQDS